MITRFAGISYSKMAHRLMDHFFSRAILNLLSQHDLYPRVVHRCEYRFDRAGDRRCAFDTWSPWPGRRYRASANRHNIHMGRDMHNRTYLLRLVVNDKGIWWVFLKLVDPNKEGG